MIPLENLNVVTLAEGTDYYVTTCTHMVPERPIAIPESCKMYQEEDYCFLVAEAKLTLLVSVQ